MAVLKIRNSAGEWVAAAPSNCINQFQTIIIAPTADGKGWDLSAYIEKDADFMIGFVFGASSASTAPGYMWHRAGNRLVANAGRAELFDAVSPTNPLDIFMNEDAIPEAMELTFDPETGILKAVKDGYTGYKVSKACLIYAG